MDPNSVLYQSSLGQCQKIFVPKTNSLFHAKEKVFAGSGISNDNLQQLIETFDTIPTDDLSKDHFGQIYEYFLRNFHKKIGQKGGEFFTPESIVQLLVEIIEPYEGIIYDPTCGSGARQNAFFKESFHNQDDSKSHPIFLSLLEPY